MMNEEKKDLCHRKAKHKTEVTVRVQQTAESVGSNFVTYLTPATDLSFSSSLSENFTTPSAGYCWIS